MAEQNKHVMGRDQPGHGRMAVRAPSGEPAQLRGRREELAGISAALHALAHRRHNVFFLLADFFFHRSCQPL